MLYFPILGLVVLTDTSTLPRQHQLRQAKYERVSDSFNRNDTVKHWDCVVVIHITGTRRVILGAFFTIIQSSIFCLSSVSGDDGVRIFQWRELANKSADLSVLRIRTLRRPDDYVLSTGANNRARLRLPVINLQTPLPLRTFELLSFPRQAKTKWNIDATSNISPFKSEEKFGLK